MVTYSLVSTSPLMGEMCEIHLLSWSAFWTEILFLLAFLKRAGAKFFSVFPCTHDEVQKLAKRPFPSVTTVDAVKRSLSLISQGSSRLVQALSGWRHWNHSQRRRRARPKRSRSKIPSPPRIFGLQDVGQLTSKWPPYTLSGVSPLQRKLLRMRLILRINHLSSWKTIMW